MEPVSSEDRGERSIGIDAFDALGEKIRETHDFNGLQFLEPFIMGNGIGDDDFAEGAVFNERIARIAEHGVNGGNLNGYGAGIEKGFRADDGAFARVDHVIDHDTFFTFDFADDVHGLGLEVIGTTLVDNREGRIEDFGEFPGAIDPAVVRGNDDDIPVIIATLLDGFGKERNGGQIIPQAREESLDLGSVKVDRDDAIDACRGQ